ncbi:MAG: MarR family transcriptional regulator [Candidatus Thorarchaeota archaeon]
MNISVNDLIYREDLLKDNSTKIKIMTDIPGTIKTHQALEYSINNYKNNICFFNTQRLSYEFHENLINPNSQFNLRSRDNIINQFYGKFKELTDEEKIDFNVNQSHPCNMSMHDNNLFLCMKKGYTPYNFCNNYCILKYQCFYKKLTEDNIKSAIDSQNVNNVNIMNLMTKSHIHTKLIERMFKEFNDINIIMDENFFNIIYDQININSYYLQRYKNTIVNLVMHDNNLDSLWIDFSSLINKIIDFLEGFRTIKKRLKEEKIMDEIELFLDSYTPEDLDKWNMALSITAITNLNNIRFQSVNFTNYFIKILKYIKENNDNNKDVRDHLIMNINDKIFSFIINKKDEIVDLINKSKKFIITSSVLNKDIFETLFPEFIDDYQIIKNNSFQPKFKEVWRYTRGKYPKYTLWKKGLPTVHFHNLLKITSDIVEKHRDNKILLLAFKDFIKNQNGNFIEIGLAQRIPYYNTIDIKYDHWYGLEGLNEYKEYEVEVQFGCPGVPKSHISSMSSALIIQKKLLKNILIKGEQIQGSERLRSFLYPNKKIVYQLSSIINEYYPSYKDFHNLTEKKYEILLNFIRGKGSCTTDLILDEFYKNKITKQYLNKILNKLSKEGLIKKRTKRSDRGRPSIIWFI